MQEANRKTRFYTVYSMLWNEIDLSSMCWNELDYLLITFRREWQFSNVILTDLYIFWMKSDVGVRFKQKNTRSKC